MQFDATTINMLKEGTMQTIYMVFMSSLISYLIGIPLGIALMVTDKDGIRPVPLFNKVLGLAINLLRSVPFLILMIMVIPFTRLVVGKIIGPNAAVVPLIIAAAPYIGRMVESSLKEVDAGVIEAARSMGAGNLRIICRVLLVEARTSLIAGATLATGTILGYSAMSGTVGGGGLGDIAIRYGYYRYQTDIMIVCVILLVLMVQVFQSAGTFFPSNTHFG